MNKLENSRKNFGCAKNLLGYFLHAQNLHYCQEYHGLGNDLRGCKVIYNKMDIYMNAIKNGCNIVPTSSFGLDKSESSKK